MSAEGSEKPPHENNNLKGAFIRKESNFRNWVTADGSSGFKAEAGRYHLYVSYACPWAHRTLIFRKLKGLEKQISVDVVDYHLEFSGFKVTTSWKFSPEKPGCTADTINNATYLSEIYKLVDPVYEGRFTVPVLFDKQKKTIVSNESSEIIRMLNTEFNAFCKTEDQAKMDFYPNNLRAEIDELNGWIYPAINNGVYRAGFARTQEAYDIAVKEVFDGLDKIEAILAKTRYLCGNTLTEADLRLFPTLIRFDHVYHGHFKCNKKRIIDYPNIFGYLLDLYQHNGIGDTVNMFHTCQHYMGSHRNINPHGIIPIGPDIDFNQPHNREKLGK